MTLSARNNVFIGGIVFCSLSALFVIVASLDAVPAYSSIDIENIRRSTGAFQILIGRFFKPSFFAVHGSIVALVLYSLAALSVVSRYFEKTQAPEMLYIAFFILSVTCEAARLVMPLQLAYENSFFYPLIASRILLFGRYFGLFSLFAASIFAAGLETKKQRYPILMITATALTIALGTPVDALAWDTNFNTINGYVSMFRLLNTGILLITVTGFLFAAHTRGSREYLFIGLGAFLCFSGRNILLSADTWIGLAGLVLLSLGTWFICNRLHKVYLWL
jgi:hypothetical protein